MTHRQPAGGPQQHWDDTYHQRGPSGVSWYQAEPTVSLELIDELGVDRRAPVIDIGGGASLLVDRLAAAGFADLSVLDISDVALATARERVGPAAGVTWIRDDIRSWTPERRFGLWHDRAVFHFLTDPTDRARYLETLGAALAPGGALVMATFAADGPTHCSGLPVARYSPDELAATIGPRYHVVATRREQHATPAGGRQSFTWLAARADD